MIIIGNLFFGAVLVLAGLILAGQMFIAKPNDSKVVNYAASISIAALYVIALQWFGAL